MYESDEWYIQDGLMQPLKKKGTPFTSYADYSFSPEGKVDEEWEMKVTTDGEDS